MMANRIESTRRRRCSARRRQALLSVYNTLPAEQLTYVRQRDVTKVVICEQQYVDRVRASGAHEHIVRVDGAPPARLPTDLYAAASGDFFGLRVDVACRTPEDIVTLIYIVRHNGNPKGVEMTHANLLFEGYAIDEVFRNWFGDG